MRFIRQIKLLNTKILVLNIQYVIYFLTSITMPDPQTRDMRQIR